MESAGGSENGWGINIAQQGKTIFGTWFAYDTTGKGWWLTLITDDSKSTATVFHGDLFRPSGPRFDADDGNQFSVNPEVGTLTLTITDGNNASITYTVQLASTANSSTHTRIIPRQLFSTTGTSSQ